MGAGERTRYYQVRPRRVPPEFASDELLEDCSVLAVLLLYRLISLADDQGRLRGHPRTVRAGAFPMRPTVSERKVAAALRELVRAGFVFHYDVANRWYIQIVGWFDMQGKWAQRRTYPSRYPALPGWTHDWVTVGTDEDEVRALGAQDARDVPPPTASSSSVSSTVSLPRLVGPGPRGGDPTRVGELVDGRKARRMTEEQAFELGTSVAEDEQRRANAPEHAPSGGRRPEESA
jgi:hypothetical protein